METIKISVDVNLSLTDDVKKFLTALFMPKCTHGCGPTAQIAVDNFDPSQEDFSKAAPATPAAPAVPATHAAPAAPAVPAAPADAEVPEEIDIEDLRKLVSAKANDYRKEIKEELNKLGSPSVTKLDKSKYNEMYNFLIKL